jgi:TonB family protein
MNIPEEFGKYLLLKKLTEDTLGETFRAGRVGKEGMEQVVLLRVLNGKGMDGEKLWQKIAGRGAVQQALRSPNIGSGVDLGRVRSFPYAAYDYISGKNLATLFAQATRQMSPIPADHALLIAERLALALAAAYENRVQDERVLHGFVIPQLVMISNEGETRLLGFEIAPGLRELAAAGWQSEEMLPYLSPETLAGTPLSRADDVYSLGAILFELLTGERLPAATADGYGARIDAAALGNDGTPLPPAIAALLKKSLVGREQRIADAVTWHKTLSKLMIDGHYGPTTFNLAFFMHNLFRDEIERESQEIQAEKSLEIPRRAAAGAATVAIPMAAVASAPAPDMREKTGVREATWPGAVPAQPPAAPAGKKPLWIGLAAGVVVAAGIGGYLLFGLPAKSGPAAKPAAAAAVPAAQPPLTSEMTGAAAAAPAGPSPEELQAQIQKMFEARSKEMESKFKAQYDDRIKQLQQQLADSRKAPEPEKTRVERSAPPPVQAEPTENRQPARSEPAAQPASLQASNVQPPAAVPQPSAAEAQPTAPAVPQPTRQPQVQVGDLVQAGPGVAVPKLRSLPEPRYPLAAQRLNKSAQVVVRVLVDERGRVVDAAIVGARAGLGFDEAAIEAARRASFNPAVKDGVRVKMWTSLGVTFKP